MEKYCYDQYGHPLLWCDEKKRIVERKNAEESIQLWQKKKAEELKRTEQDKREVSTYNEMLIKHCPWGKPGGGAPNLNVRIRDITAAGLYPTPKCTVRSSASQPCHVKIPFGGTAQIRSAADRVYITVKDPPVKRYEDNNSLDIELRYKTPSSLQKKPKIQLEKIVVSKKPETELKGKKKSITDGVGKIAPKNKTSRSVKGVGSSFMRSLGYTSKEQMEELDQENLPNVLEKKSAREATKQSPSKSELKRCCPLCICECPTTTASTSTSTQPKSPTKKQSTNTINKSGNSEGSKTICPRTMRNTTVNFNNTEFKVSEIHKREKDIKPRECMISNQGGVELVPLLARRRRMHRPVSLSSTDVTKRVDKNRFTHYDVNYLNELRRQMKQKQRRNRLNRELEQELCTRHFETFETFWGRPGHGAPTSIKTKFNLDDLLYGGMPSTDC